MAFKKGQSGNPKGRQPGTTPAARLRKAIDERADELLKVVLDAAIEEGDPQAAMSLLSKVIPNLRATSAPIEIKIDPAKGLSQSAEKVLNAMATGEVELDSGSQLVASLASVTKMREVDELTKRVEALEAVKT